MTSDEVAKLLADTAAEFIPNLSTESAKDIGVVIIFTNERLRRASAPLISGDRPTAELIKWAMSMSAIPVDGEVESFEKGNAS